MPEVACATQGNNNDSRNKDSCKESSCLNELGRGKDYVNLPGQAECDKIPSHVPIESSQFDFGTQLKLIRMNDQVRELQTILRDRTTCRSDFVFYADRLIRLVVEEGLNQLPYKTCTVRTPTGSSYEGLAFQRGNCGVSIMRSGEAMEKGLRDCCRSIRIGKILIKTDEDTKTPKIYYAKFPADVDQRKVLLMYPLLNSGATVITALNVLKEHGVKDKNVIMLTVFATPQGVAAVLKQFPNITILTSEVHSDCPSFFGQKYFGTD